MHAFNIVKRKSEARNCSSLCVYHAALITKYFVYSVLPPAYSVLPPAYLLFFICGATTQLGPRPPRCRDLSHTHTHSRTHTPGRTPLSEWSPRRGGRYLHNNHKRGTSVRSAGFEHVILAIEREQTYALNRGICIFSITPCLFRISPSVFIISPFACSITPVFYYYPMYIQYYPLYMQYYPLYIYYYPM